VAARGLVFEAAFSIRPALVSLALWVIHRASVSATLVASLRVPQPKGGTETRGRLLLVPDHSLKENPARVAAAFSPFLILEMN